MEKDLKKNGRNSLYGIGKYLRSIIERDNANEILHGITFTHINISYFEEVVNIHFLLTHVPVNNGTKTNELWEAIIVELLDSDGNRIGQNQFQNIYNIGKYDLSADIDISASCAYSDIAKIVINIK